MGLLGDLKDNVVLLGAGGRLTGTQKAFVAVQLVTVLFLVVFLILLVFVPDVYGLNMTGIVMSRIALAAVVLVPVMNKIGQGISDEIEQAKRDMNRGI